MFHVVASSVSEKDWSSRISRHDNIGVEVVGNFPGWCFGRCCDLCNILGWPCDNNVFDFLFIKEESRRYCLIGNLCRNYITEIVELRYESVLNNPAAQMETLFANFHFLGDLHQLCHRETILVLVEEWKRGIRYPTMKDNTLHESRRENQAAL